MALNGERKGWRPKEVHPAADVFPMMADDELAALAEDIKKTDSIDEEGVLIC